MTFSKAVSRKTKQAVLSGDEQTTGVLDGSHTTATIELTGPASKITLQSTGDLAYTYTVSMTGQDFVAGGTVAATVPSSYSTHNVAAILITRTSGTGRVVCLAT